MSSALRTVSQIEPTVKFLRQLPSADPSANLMYVSDADMHAFVAANVSVGNGLNTIVESAGAPTFLYIAQTTPGWSLVRDLGRRVTIANPSTCAHRQVWIQVQRVNGSGSEGVGNSSPEYGTIWIRVFRDVDDGPNVEWARLG